MDKLSVHQKGTKRAKSSKNKKQVKVVYISNPMRFTASASEFKGLVQQFTGRDSDVADLYKLADADEPPAPAHEASSFSFSSDDASGGGSAPPQQWEAPYGYVAAAAPFEAFDEVFTPQVLENLAAFVPSSLYYEPPRPVM